MSSPPVEQALLDAVQEIAEQAVEFVAHRYHNEEMEVEIKADGSEVTDVDRRAEQLVREAVIARFPNDTVIGEEAGITEGRSGRTWIVDPIDGTASFVRGVPLFATLLAVYDEYGPAAGVVAMPALDEILVAGRSMGCTHNGRPNKVSGISALSHSCLSSSSFDGSWWPEHALLNVVNSGAHTRTWGDGYGYFLVATGRIEAMIEPALNTWDIAPMLTVIPESGGRITTWSGNQELEQGVGWIASNGEIHDELLDLIR